MRVTSHGFFTIVEVAINILHFSSMAPRVDVDMKLNLLREYVGASVKQLAAKGERVSRRFFSRLNPHGKRFYKFLANHEHTVTSAQSAHAEETLALLLKSAPNQSTYHDARPGSKRKAITSGGAHPSVRNRSCFPLAKWVLI